MFIPPQFPNSNYHVILDEGEGEKKENHVNYKFDRIDLICLAVASVIGVWYLLKKHWIANNIFGLAFSLTGVELLHLNRLEFLFMSTLISFNKLNKYAMI